MHMITRALQDKVDAFDNMFLCRILHIPYTDHVTNATVRLQADSPVTTSAVSTHPGQMASILGHVARMNTSHDITRALKVSIRGLPRDWRLYTVQTDVYVWHHALLVVLAIKEEETSV